LNEKCGPLWRYQALLRACSPHSLLPSDQSVLDKHGMRSAALGSNPMQWMEKYVADNLRFVEYERMALACALMRSKRGNSSHYKFAEAGKSITP